MTKRGAESLNVTARSGYPLKRAFDLVISLIALTIAGPVLLVSLLLVWLQDRHGPLYKARRVARGGGWFTMYKVRSMVIAADKTGVNSTGAHDNRITGVGRLIRKCKIDELSQFINVLIGDMAAVGPRPNTWAWGVELYTDLEHEILTVRPGITDLSSIVFSDEGAILDGAENPDLLYNQIIRPWKNQLALWYIKNMTLGMDIRICWLTVLAITNKQKAIAGVVALLERDGASTDLIAVCRRDDAPPAAAPPGGDRIENGRLYLGPERHNKPVMPPPLQR